MTGKSDRPAPRVPDRRGSPRVPTAGSLQAHLSLEAKVLYLSSSGMMIRLPFAPEIGSRHALTLALGPEAIEATGSVRNSEALPAEEGGGYRVGVEFEELGRREREILERFIAEKLKAT